MSEDPTPSEIARALDRIETAMVSLQADVTAIKVNLAEGSGKFARIEDRLGVLEDSRRRTIGAIVTLGIGVLSALIIAILGDFIHVG